VRARADLRGWFAALAGACAGAPPDVRVNGRRYRGLAVLHGGRKPTVWIARDEHARRVVLKRPCWCFDDEDDARFADEYRILASIAHPNVVAALDFGRDQRSGEWLLVMEHVDGRPLAAAIRALAEHEIAQLLLTLLALCAFLAERGIAHCDLKPDNILLTRDRTPRLADFGVATRHGEPPKGCSPAFVAPEQLFDGDAAAVDAATDLFALGVSFYWLLAGRHPYFADAEPIVYRPECYATPPARPTRWNPTLDPWWDAALPGLVDREPQRRIAHARRLADQSPRLR
jgi:serine/threonine protein kinase